jgi:heat shock protein HtpX
MRIAFNEVSNNKLKSYFLIIFFIIIIGLIGATIGIIYNNTYFGLIIALLFSIVYSIICYYSGDSMILSMSGATEATKKDYPLLINTIEGLVISGGLKSTPKAYIINDSALNAFATGRDPEHASITVTTGLLNTMNRQELEGVIAHEMSHIKNYDIRFMMLTAILVGIVTLMSDFLLRSFLWGGKNKETKGGRLGLIMILVGLAFAILAPIFSEMIKLAISRKREYMADAEAVVLTRYPQGLANALKKIQKDPDPLVDTANKATAHLFISKPFRNEGSFLANLFSTHPPIEERIKRLEQM